MSKKVVMTDELCGIVSKIVENKLEYDVIQAKLEKQKNIIRNAAQKENDIDCLTGGKYNNELIFDNGSQSISCVFVNSFKVVDKNYRNEHLMTQKQKVILNDCFTNTLTIKLLKNFCNDNGLNFDDVFKIEEETTFVENVKERMYNLSREELSRFRSAVIQRKPSIVINKH